jgi:hypothetical protein
MSLPHRHGRIVHPKNGDPLFLAVRQSRRDHVQAPTDFSSEMAAPSMAPAAMTPSDSTSANLVYLYHVSGEEREGCANGEQAPPFQYPGPLGFSAVGCMFRRLRLLRREPANLAGFNVRKPRQG